MERKLDGGSDLGIRSSGHTSRDCCKWQCVSGLCNWMALLNDWNNGHALLKAFPPHTQCSKVVWTLAELNQMLMILLTLAEPPEYRQQVSQEIWSLIILTI